MIEVRNAREWVVRLQDGEDVSEALRSVTEGSALVVAGIGMVRNAELGFWNGKTYDVHPHPAPAELVCLQGNLAVDPAGNRIAHLHAVLAAEDGTVSGGHLLRATVHNTVEMGLLPLEGIALERRPEPNGLVGLFPTSR